MVMYTMRKVKTRRVFSKQKRYRTKKRNRTKKNRLQLGGGDSPYTVEAVIGLVEGLRRKGRNYLTPWAAGVEHYDGMYLLGSEGLIQAARKGDRGKTQLATALIIMKVLEGTQSGTYATDLVDYLCQRSTISCGCPYTALLLTMVRADGIQKGIEDAMMVNVLEEVVAGSDGAASDGAASVGAASGVVAGDGLVRHDL
jgi:hypothetical protein